MSDLIPPHGGLAELVSCTVPADKVDSFLAETSSLEKVPVSDADLSTVYRFGDGALTPLTGPMDEATWNRVLDQASIESNGADYAWTIPLALPVTADLAGKLSAGQSVALTNSGGETVARLAISSIYAWDKPRYLQAVYGTDRTDHPGAKMAVEACLLYTSPSPRDQRGSRMPSSA